MLWAPGQPPTPSTCSLGCRHKSNHSGQPQRLHPVRTHSGFRDRAPVGSGIGTPVSLGLVGVRGEDWTHIRNTSLSSQSLPHNRLYQVFFCRGTSGGGRWLQAPDCAGTFPLWSVHEAGLLSHGHRMGPCCAPPVSTHCDSGGHGPWRPLP